MDELFAILMSWAVTLSGIVVHEMVHYLQQQSGHFEVGFTCALALKRERD